MKKGAFMNKGQEMFYNFYMNMVKEGKEEQADKLLKDGFTKQESGEFFQYFPLVEDKYFELIREECVDSLKEAMSHFINK
ncbi:hypothetical protein ACQRBF_06060 [Peptoniphilaceae bacterium SGI.131]